METTFDDMIEKVRRFRREKNKIALEVVRKNENSIIALQRKQMDQGIDSDGNIIGYYSDYTKRKKKKEGKPYGRVNLEDEGDFKEGLRITTFYTFFIIDSDDSKETDILLKYNSRIYGLTPENLEIAKLIVMAGMRIELKKRLLG